MHLVVIILFKEDRPKSFIRVIPNPGDFQFQTKCYNRDVMIECIRWYSILV